jgi:hypothetical protein
MGNEELPLKVVKILPFASRTGVIDKSIIEDDVQVDRSRSVPNRRYASDNRFDSFDKPQQCQRGQIGFYLFGESAHPCQGKDVSLTTQAPLINFGWSVTYIGSVS